MTLIALAWVVVPLLRHQRSTAIAREASNVAILRDQSKELERDLATGALTPGQHDEARRELEARVLEESRPQDTAPVTPMRAGRRSHAGCPPGLQSFHREA